MAFRKFNQPGRKPFGPRPMIKGNWKCSECETEITELPFEPTADRPIYCRECWRKKESRNFNLKSVSQKYPA